MVRDGYFYALGLGVVAVLVWLLTQSIAFTLLPVLVAFFFLWFFRDPDRQIPAGPGEIVSPADGVVTEADWIETANGSRFRISIFLNVFDVHMNRSPISGVIKSAVYKKGQFGNAMASVSADDNEQNIVTMEGDGMTVVFKQIAGLLARRIVFNHKPGEKLARGQRVGMIKFGSRMDVMFGPEWEMAAKVGQRVSAGSTVIARRRDRDGA